jgi:hypothetical protein
VKRRDDGEERRWLDLDVGPEEGGRRLRIEGKCCEAAREWSLPFYRD